MRVSLFALLAMTLLMLLNVPPIPFAVPLKPSTLPIEVNTTLRAAVIALKSSVSVPLLPSTLPTTLAPSTKMNVSLFVPPMKFSILP